MSSDRFCRLSFDTETPIGYSVTYCMQLGIRIVGHTIYCIFSTFFIGICAQFICTPATSTKKISYKYYSKKTSNSRQLTQKLKEEILLNGHMSRCYCSCSYHARYFVCSFLQLQQFDAGTILQSVFFSFHLVETEILIFYCIWPYRIVRIFGWYSFLCIV